MVLDPSDGEYVTKQLERPQPRRFAVANQKGGVGKTATTTGLASAISSAGGRALLIDLDPQGNLTTGIFGYQGWNKIQDKANTVYDLLRAGSTIGATEVAIGTPWPGIDIMPATRSLAELEDDSDMLLAYRLLQALEDVDLGDYDAVFYDCPPSLGKLMFIALTAATDVLGVVEPAADSAQGWRELSVTIDRVRSVPNPSLRTAGLVISRYSGTREHDDIISALTLDWGDLIFKTKIPHLTKRQEAHSRAQPIHKYKGALPLEVAYDDLLKELGIIESVGSHA